METDQLTRLFKALSAVDEIDVKHDLDPVALRIRVRKGEAKSDIWIDAMTLTREGSNAFDFIMGHIEVAVKDVNGLLDKKE